MKTLLLMPGRQWYGYIERSKETNNYFVSKILFYTIIYLKPFEHISIQKRKWIYLFKTNKTINFVNRQNLKHRTTFIIFT